MKCLKNKIFLKLKKKRKHYLIIYEKIFNKTINRFNQKISNNNNQNLEKKIKKAKIAKKILF